MENPKPVNLTDDDHWRKLGWPAVARDKDGHVVSTCAKDGYDDIFNEWLRECFEEGLTVTNLDLDQAESALEDARRRDPNFDLHGGMVL